MNIIYILYYNISIINDNNVHQESSDKKKFKISV